MAHLWLPSCARCLGKVSSKLNLLLKSMGCELRSYRHYYTAKEPQAWTAGSLEGHKSMPQGFLVHQEGQAQRRPVPFRRCLMPHSQVLLNLLSGVALWDPGQRPRSPGRNPECFSWRTKELLLLESTCNGHVLCQISSDCHGVTAGRCLLLHF